MKPTSTINNTAEVQLVEPIGRRNRVNLRYDKRPIYWPLTLDHIPPEINAVGVSLARGFRECA